LLCGFDSADDSFKEVKMAINPELLDILVCPKCKGQIYMDESQNNIICDNCRLRYEIRDDIPIMLIEQAHSLDDSG
jgi:uncharacterized protein YbaR (Trm112 family)